MKRELAAAALAALAFAAPASAASTRYAGPAGDSTKDCTTTAQACEIHKAVQGASAGDTVVVLPGDYEIGSTVPIDKALTLAGNPGDPAPRLNGTPTIGGPVVSIPYASPGPSGSVTLRRLSISGTAANQPTLALDGFIATVVEQVVASAEGSSAPAIERSCGQPLVRDSVARTTGQGATAVMASGRGSTVDSSCGGSLDLHNTTIDARGTNAPGMSATALAAGPGYCAAIAVVLRNSIVRGTATDVRATSQPPGNCPNNGQYAATVVSSYSNFRNKDEQGGATIGEGSAHQSSDPAFADAERGDYRELSTSPTIDAGDGSDPKLGTVDPDGHARSLGKAPDIGAYEFVPPNAPPPPGGRDTKPPSLTRLRLEPPGFRTSGKSAGTTISYSLSETGRTTFTVKRRRTGRRSGGRCVRRTHANRRHRHCTLFTAVAGSFGHTSTAPGPATVHFSGRLGGHPLAPGQYRLRAVPRDAAGNTGPARTIAFTVRTPKR
jgi:hypothetical protein